jgi:hypothetical protein
MKYIQQIETLTTSALTVGSAVAGANVITPQRGSEADQTNPLTGTTEITGRVEQRDCTLNTINVDGTNETKASDEVIRGETSLH